MALTTKTDQDVTTAPTGVNLDADNTLKICYRLIGTVGCTGNLLVIVVMLYSKHLRKAVTNLLIINQSALDFTASLLILLQTLIQSEYLDTLKTNTGRELFCRLWLTNMFLWGVFVSSTYNLLTVTYERYFAIVYPMKIKWRLTPKNAYIIMSVVWVFGPAFNAAYMIPSSAIHQGVCAVFMFWPDPLVQQAVGITVIVIQFFIPLALIVFAYIRIAIVLKNSAHGASDNRQEKISRARNNVVKTLLMVSVCFILCWICNQVYFFLFNLGYDKIDFNSSFYHFTVIAVFCNSCLNPILYSIKYVQFQKAVAKLFSDLKEKICFKNAIEEGDFGRKAVFYLPNHMIQLSVTDTTVVSSSLGSDIATV